MIASWRGLAIAGAIAVVLAAALLVDGMRIPEAIDRALLPGFEPARATELIWARPGQSELRAARTGERWELRAPAISPADPGAISDVLAALRGGRWHRRGAAHPAHATLTVVAGDTRHAVGIAEPSAPGDQVWLTIDGTGLLVDAWIARALDRDRLALQIRLPLAGAASARAIAITGRIPDELASALPAAAAPGRAGAVLAAGAPGAPTPGTPARAGATSAASAASSPAAVPAATSAAGPVELTLEGWPRRLVRPVPLWLAPDLAGELERALRDMAIVRIPEGPLAGQRELHLTIRISGSGTPAEVIAELGGACPGAPSLVAISGSAGDGCVERAAAAAVVHAVAALQQPPDQIAERRLVPFEPQRIALLDGAALQLSPPRIGDAPADPTRIAELLAALAAPATAVRRPVGPPSGQLVATDRTGHEVVLALYPERVVARAGEPIALAPPPGAWALLVRPSRELRDPALWLEEPATIAELRIDGARYRRGQAIGDWTLDGAAAGPRTQEAIESLAAALAAPRALGFLDGPVVAAHRLTVVIAPPAGAPVEHAIEIGAPRPAGCPARVAQSSVLLPAALCAQITALAQTPRR